MQPLVSILSTKVISKSLQESLSAAHIECTNKDFISIEFNTVALKNVDLHETILITSKNVIKSLIQSDQVAILKNKVIYCVGTSIPQLLTEHGISVQQTFKNALELGSFIVAKKITVVTFFCGNKSRPELPALLQQNHIEIQRFELYTTQLTPHILKSKFDAILFFCPSAVESYLQHHQINNEKIICIGQTTASAVRPYTDHIILADQHQVSSVIHKTIELFQTS